MTVILKFLVVPAGITNAFVHVRVFPDVVGVTPTEEPSKSADDATYVAVSGDVGKVIAISSRVTSVVPVFSISAVR